MIQFVKVFFLVVLIQTFFILSKVLYNASKCFLKVAKKSYDSGDRIASIGNKILRRHH